MYRYVELLHSGSTHDTYVNIILIFVADRSSFNLYFIQGTTSLNEGTPSHNVKAMDNQLGRLARVDLQMFTLLQENAK